MIKGAKIVISYLVILFLCEGCFTIKYSLSGANIHPDMKTISVQYFQNRASIVKPTLSQEFTEALREKFRSQTSLKLVNDIGDADFEGEITKYSTQPIAIQANEVASQNRLTIEIRVRYTDRIEPEKSWEQSFSRYEDVDATTNITDVESELIEIIIEQITEDIFNAAFVNW